MELDMSGDIKKQKLWEGSSIAGNRIELEDLPEPILVRILSFLPTKDVLKASVLSKRWKDLWKYIDSFRIREGLVSTHSQRKLFRDTMDRLLLLRDALDISLFSISCGVDDEDQFEDEGNGDDGHDDDKEDGEARVNTWISVALKHRVQVLNLQLYVELSFDLHPSLFISESLTELKLDMFHHLSLPTDICFPHLKILSIKHVTFLDEQSTNRLLSGCPVLVKLTLDECCLDYVKAICISIPTLENLFIFENDDDNNCQVVISGSSLRTFDYVGELKNDYCLGDLSSLLDASVVVCIALSSIAEMGCQKEVAYRAHKLLKGLSHVTELYLTHDIIKILSYTKELFSFTPVFKNLNHLRVNFGAVDFACEALQNLLRKFPSLATLEFLKGITFNSSGDIYEFGN